MKARPAAGCARRSGRRWRSSAAARPARPTGSRTRNRSRDRGTPGACSRSTGASAPAPPERHPRRRPCCAPGDARPHAPGSRSAAPTRRHPRGAAPAPARRASRCSPTTRTRSGRASRSCASITAATWSSESVRGNACCSRSRTARPRGRLRAIPCRNGLYPPRPARVCTTRSRASVLPRLRLKLIEADHAAQHPVDRARRQARRLIRQHDDVLGRPPRPRRELAQLHHRRPDPSSARARQETSRTPAGHTHTPRPCSASAHSPSATTGTRRPARPVAGPDR